MLARCLRLAESDELGMHLTDEGLPERWRAHTLNGV